MTGANCWQQRRTTLAVVLVVVGCILALPAATWAQAASITVTYPNGGENVFVASSQTVTWTSTGTIANVKIELSLNAGSSWATIVASTPNTGSYHTYPGNSPSTQCLIRISDVSNPAVFDVSDAVFTISGDSAEPNGTFATAATLPMGATDTLLFSDGDSDWYKFFVAEGAAGQDLKVRLKVISQYPVPPPANWRSDIDFALFDSAQHLVADTVSASDDETLYLHNPPSGWYYIHVPYCTTSYADGQNVARYAVTLETGTSFGLGYVTGRVVDSGGGDPIAAVSVGVAGPAEYWRFSSAFLTAADGTFTVAREPGTIRLIFYGADDMAYQPPVNVMSKRYPGDVSVTTGVTVDVGDIAMEIGAIVSGRVTDPNGAGLSMASVSASNPSGTVTTASVWTDANGYYTVVSVPPGGAVVRVSGGSYAPEFYDNQPSRGTATVLPTVSGGTLSGIDIQMGTGGTVSGNVRNLLGTGIAGISVRLYSVLDGTYSAATATSAATTGAFTFTRILPGDYKLYFYSANGAYVSEWHNDAATFATATPVTVTNGGSVSGIVAILANGAPEIAVTQGTTPLASGGTFDFGARVVATDTDTVFTISSAGTSNLVLSGLPLTIGGTDAGQFAVVAQPMSPVLPGGSTSFTIRFHPTSLGTKTAQVSIANNDADENPSVFILTGTGIADPPRTAGDFDGDGKSDILWRHAARGEVWEWPMDGTAPVSETLVRTVSDTDWEIRGLGDQTGDGKADILWRNKTTGQIYLWPMDGTTVLSETYVATVDLAYDIVGTGDYNGDGKSDMLWRHMTTGAVWIWLMNGTTPLSQVWVDTVDPAYAVVGSGDLNGDTKADIVWHHATAGEVWVWLMDGTTRLSQTWIGTVADVGYQIVGVADHTGDGKADILWHHATRGEVWIWPMNGTTVLSQSYVDTVADTGYQIVGSGDYNGDTKADILWHHATRGEVWVWLMDGVTKVSQTWVATVQEVGYQIVNVK